MARNTMESWLKEEQGTDIIRKLEATSIAETRLRSVPMSGNTKTEPRMVDMSVEVVAKGGTYGEDTGANDEVTLIARKFGRALRIAEEDIDDNIANVLEAKKASWVSSFAVAFDNAVFGTSAAENGTTVPFTSVYKALKTTNVDTGYTANDNYLETEGGLTYDDISDVAALVESGGYASGAGDIFVAHMGIKGKLRKIKDLDGNPIFTASPRVDDPDTLFGYPLLWTNGAVVTATAKSNQAVSSTPGVAGTAGNPLIVFGNPDFGIVGKRSSVESVFIDGRDGLSALTDECILKMRARRAFVVGHEAAWAVLEVTAAP